VDVRSDPPVGPDSASLRVTLEQTRRYDRPGPRYTSYPTAVEFHDGFGPDAYADALRAASSRDGPLSLYLHLPFCEARCLYCACNVVITPHTTVAEPYLDYLEREADLVAAQLGTHRPVAQLHLGGGTPTYFAPEQLRDLMGRLRRRFAFADGAEMALEVDPRVTTRDHLEALAEEGFNRLSLGVQDFDPTVQETVRRVQSVEQTRALMEDARELGFGSLNIDLIYGLPHQAPASFARTLREVIELRPDRLAVYSFALVPWLKQHQKLLPEEAMPDAETKLELLRTARELLTGAGYRDIGMDHFALPNDELSRAQRDGRLWRNFMGYTTVRAPDLVGLGISAIGSVGDTFAQNEKKLSRYYAALDAGRLPVERGYALSDDDVVRQHVIRSWMCQFEVDKADVERRFGVRFDDYFASELATLQREFVPEGLVRLAPEAIRAEPLGRLFPRNVAMVFDAHLRAKRGDGPVFSRTV
jgi:oxygen-independent coproporphyrinogen-3 oxidase